MYQSLLGKLDRSLSIIFNNLPGDGMGAITTFSLNRSYDFTDIGDERTVAENYSDAPGLICRPTQQNSDITLYSCAAWYTETHGPTANNEPPLRPVFLKRAYPRSAPFIPHEISAVAGPAQSMTLESMKDLNALPVLFNNNIQVNVKDGVTHVSTYLLNSSYDFVEVMNSVTLPTLYHADMGVKFIAVALTSMSSLVSFYHHLNMKQLADIAVSHRVHVPKTKPELLVSLMTHACHDQCVGIHKVLLFCRSRLFREGVVIPRTIRSVRHTEELHRSKVQIAKARNAGNKKDAGPPQDKKQAVRDAEMQAKTNFPYICLAERQQEIASEWQAQLDPPAWIPKPCALCGRNTAVKNLTPANPLQYDLTLLQNPCLPVATLPATYNFEAYDRAILCPLALRDRMKKGVFNLFNSCMIPWERGQPPKESPKRSREGPLRSPGGRLLHTPGAKADAPGFQRTFYFIIPDHKSFKGLFVWLIPPADHMLQTHLESRPLASPADRHMEGLYQIIYTA
ncbi:hypothetical protein C8R44DRAFT_745328 [Mycena epipterygia]|nr:hypothetical protein C8R44DRAFT_745328 [Mycena epipterygia]